MRVLEYGDHGAQIILVQPVNEQELNNIEREISYIAERTRKKFRLAAFPVEDWNRDLSPWTAPAVFGKDDFGDGAARTLEEIVAYCDQPSTACSEERSRIFYLGGYSLAGLFALWAAGQSNVFRGIAAASPSVWFPGFETYLKEHPFHTDCVYLSLGDKEARTRNPVMATVDTRIREVQTCLQGQGIDHILEWNPGNHFRDTDLRMAKAFAWLMEKGKY